MRVLGWGAGPDVNDVDFLLNSPGQEVPTGKPGTLTQRIACGLPAFSIACD